MGFLGISQLSFSLIDSSKVLGNCQLLLVPGQFCINSLLDESLTILSELVDATGSGLYHLQGCFGFGLGEVQEEGVEVLEACDNISVAC